MSEETVKETTYPYTQRADEGLFGDAVDDAPAAAAQALDANEQDTQGPVGAEDTSYIEAQTDAPEDLKVVVSIKGGRATIGVQRPSSDPHVESFEEADLNGLAREISAVAERAKAKWQETPKHPAYVRPAPSGRRRNQRRRESVQGATTEAQEQQTLRLF